MTTQSLSLFQAMGAKMSYLDQRQNVISQNIANADTPGYRPHDLTEVDFGRVLKKTTGERVVHPEVTNRQHMPAPGQISDPRHMRQREVYEVAPAGNAVVMEEQMVKANQTMMDYNLMTTLYQKNVGMIKIALGSGQ